MSFSPATFNNALHYGKYVSQFMKTYYGLFEWPNKQNLRVIDIGSGPGHTLMRIEKKLPINYEEIIGIDRSREMVNYFNSVPKDPRISSRLMNIETTELPNVFQGRFDLAFSSYCFTYVKNYRLAFKNTNDLLKPNGELLFWWCKIAYLYEIYKTLHQTKEWAPYTSDFKNWTSQFNNDDPIGMLEDEFKRVDLKILKCEVLDDLSFDEHDADYHIDVFLALNEVADRIPKCDLPKFKEDFGRIVRSYMSVDSEATDRNIVKLPFPTIVVGARKL